MHLEKISLSNFKNYVQCALELSDHINCIVGPNGSGKTNLLDAIHYLCLTKSAFNSVDQQNIQYEQDFFAIRGEFQKGADSYSVVCSAQNGKKKVIKLDQQPYSKLSEHVGIFPLVMITPYDIDLVRDSSSTRRKFLNNMMAQCDATYLQQLIRYQHILKQRNQLLKSTAGGQPLDRTLLQSYDHPLIALAVDLHGKREEFLKRFTHLFLQHYKMISDDAEETVDIKYKSDCAESDFEQAYQDALGRDLALQRTTMGVHRDDLEFLLNQRSIKKIGSQGQLKCFVIALKLAQFEILKEIKAQKPLLLMDDIFDKLDDHRIAKLMNMVDGNVFGQIFITDARPERTTRILDHLQGDVRTFLVAAGEISVP